MLRARLYLPNPEKGEKIELILRRHSLIMVWHSIIFIFLLIVPWVFRWFIINNFSGLWLNGYYHAIFYLGGSIYILFIILFFFANFIDYWLDVWIITNERIVSIEQKGIFARIFVEQKFYRLQDVTSRVEGFLPTIFHYGDVVVQSAGTMQNSVLKQIPKADIVARKIVILMEETKRKHEKK